MNGYLQGKCRSEQQLMNELTKLIATKDFTSKKMSELMKELGFFYVSPMTLRIPHSVFKDLSVLLSNLKDKKEDLRIAKLAICFLSRLLDQLEVLHHHALLQTTKRTQSFEVSTVLASNLLKYVETSELNHASIPRQVTCMKLYAHLCRLFGKSDLLLLRLKPLIQKSPVWSVLQTTDKKAKASVMNKKDYIAQTAAMGAAFHAIRFHLTPEEQEPLLETLFPAAFLPHCSASRHAAATLLKLFEHSREYASAVIKILEWFLMKYRPCSLLVGDELATHYLLRLVGQVSRLPVDSNESQATKSSPQKQEEPVNLLDFSYEAPTSAAPVAPASPPPSPIARQRQRVEGLSINASLRTRLKEWLLDILCSSDPSIPKSILLVAVEETVKDADAESCFMKTRANVCVFEIVSSVLLKMFQPQGKDKSDTSMSVVALHRVCRVAQFTAESLDGAVLQMTASAHQPQYLDRITDKMMDNTTHMNEFIARESLKALVWLLPRNQSTSWDILLQKLMNLSLERIHPELRMTIAQALFDRAVTNPMLYHQQIDAEMLRKCLRVTLVWLQTLPCHWHADMLVRIWQTALRKASTTLGNEVVVAMASVLDFQPTASAQQTTLQIKHATLDFITRTGAAYCVLQAPWFQTLVLRLTKTAVVEANGLTRRLAIKALVQIKMEAHRQVKMDMVQHLMTILQYMAKETDAKEQTNVLMASKLHTTAVKQVLHIQDLLAPEQQQEEATRPAMPPTRSANGLF